MRAKKRRRTKGPPDPPEENRMDSPDVSAIDKASFMDGLQLNYGNPLHSTALDEDLNVPEEEQLKKRTAEGGDVPKTLKTGGKQRRAAARSKVTEEETEGRRRSTRIKSKTSVQQEDKKTETGPDDKSEETSDPAAAQRSHRRVLSSDEEVDEDTSWSPSPKKTKGLNLGKPRKSSSGGSRPRKSSSGGSRPRKSSSGGSRPRKSSSGSGPGDESSSDGQKKTPVGRGGTHFEVVLDAFLDFCNQYSESVESAAVKQSISCFSKNVRKQLLEKISFFKDLTTLKRENTKVGSLIRTKTQRLLDVKHELMRAERQLCLLQKEETELKQRLSDLRRGQAFLHNVREVSTRYQDHRRKHRTEKETYGASSLPALLLEATLVQKAGHQLRGANKSRKIKGAPKP